MFGSVILCLLAELLSCCFFLKVFGLALTGPGFLYDWGSVPGPVSVVRLVAVLVVYLLLPSPVFEVEGSSVG